MKGKVLDIGDEMLLLPDSDFHQCGGGGWEAVGKEGSDDV